MLRKEIKSRKNKNLIQDYPLMFEFKTFIKKFMKLVVQTQVQPTENQTCSYPDIHIAQRTVQLVLLPSTVSVMLPSPVKVSSVMEISTSYIPSSENRRL